MKTWNKIRQWFNHTILLKRDLSCLDKALDELQFYHRQQLVHSSRQTILLEQINEAIQQIRKLIKANEHKKTMSNTSIFLLNKLISRVDGDDKEL